MLLLCTCPGGTGGPRPVREQCRLLSSMGPGGGLGLGTVLAQAEPLLLTSTEGLRFPGALSTARARELRPVQVPARFSGSGAGSAATSRSAGGLAVLPCACCSGSALAPSLSRLQAWDARCGAWKTACHQSPEVFLYKIILILKSVCLRMKRLPVAYLGCQAYGWGDAGAVLWSRAAQLSSVHTVACSCLCQSY